MKPRIAFATHAFSRDFRVVLSPDRFRMVVESHRHRFSDVIVVLNNFSTERERSKAQRMADKLLSQGLASQILNVREYLSDSVLSELGLNPRQYWQNNPYFSSAQFAALHWSMPRCDYLLHMTGDTWLHQPVDWIPTAINAMNEVPSMAGFNLCCGEGYARIYTRRAKEQTVRFWISRERRRFPGEDYGFTISDRGYVLKIHPGFDWRFPEPPSSFVNTWVHYAQPSFESYIAWAILSNGGCIGTLKLAPDAPSMGHKSFPKSSIKRTFYSGLGRYRPGGRYATARSQNENKAG